MGITVGCARCHDHKFDPIPTADYYSMAGIFKSTKTMENFKVVATWNEYVLAPASERGNCRSISTRSPPRRKDVGPFRKVRTIGWQTRGARTIGAYLLRCHDIARYDKIELKPAALASRNRIAVTLSRGNVSRKLRKKGSRIDPENKLRGHTSLSTI